MDLSERFDNSLYQSIQHCNEIFFRQSERHIVSSITIAVRFTQYFGLVLPCLIYCILLFVVYIFSRKQFETYLNTITQTPSAIFFYLFSDKYICVNVPLQIYDARKRGIISSGNFLFLQPLSPGIAHCPKQRQHMHCQQPFIFSSRGVCHIFDCVWSIYFFQQTFFLQTNIQR